MLRREAAGLHYQLSIPLPIRRADNPFEEELKIRMVSCEGRLCLRPKEMEPRPVKEEDVSHQEKLEETRTSSPFSQWGGSTGLYELARCSTWMVLVVTVRQMSL